MPAYLRIDTDVKNALMQVARLSREYATFNIDELEWKMQRKLEIELDRQSVLYKAHKAEVQKSLQSVRDLLQEALQLKDSCVEQRRQKHDVVVKLTERTKSFKAAEQAESQQMMAKREQLLELDAEMRKLSESLALMRTEV